MADTIPAWHVIYTKSRHEKKVAAGLSGLQIEYFLPTAKMPLDRGRKRRLQDVPLFPSYIFVRPGSAQVYYQTLQLPGVLHYVKTGKAIAQVPEEIIERLRTASMHFGSDLQLSTQRFLPGEMHHICYGPFSGLCCEVVQHHGKSKILVRVALLQRSLLLDLPAGCLVP